MVTSPLLVLMVLWIFPSAVAFFLLLFFKTRFVVEYAELFGVGAFFKAEQFSIWEKSNLQVGYPIFLREQYNCFITRLFGCPWCLASWFSMFAGIATAFAAVSFLTIFWALVFGLASSFSIGFSAMMLYAAGIKAYKSL